MKEKLKAKFLPSHYDGILPSQDLDQEVPYPNHPRTRSQTKKMAHLWQEIEASTNGLTGQNKPGFVHLIS